MKKEFDAAEFHRQIEAERDAKFGVGKWHCDDIWQDETAPACVRAFLDYARSAAHGMMSGKPKPRLFATHDGQRVKVVMASRFGDVGITADLTADRGYSKRLLLPELNDFSETADDR